MGRISNVTSLRSLKGWLNPRPVIVNTNNYEKGYFLYSLIEGILSNKKLKDFFLSKIIVKELSHGGLVINILVHEPVILNFYELIKKECKGVVCVDKWTMYVNCEVHNNEQRGKGF